MQQCDNPKCTECRPRETEKQVLARLHEEMKPMIVGKTLEEANAIVRELVQREINAGNLTPPPAPKHISVETQQGNVTTRQRITTRYGANRAEHRKNMREAKKAAKERAKVREKHEANGGVFRKLPGF